MDLWKERNKSSTSYPMFNFQHKEYLTALILIPLLVLLFITLISWKKSRIAKIGDARLVKELIKDFSPFKFILRFVIFLLALGALITGTANLQSPGAMEKVARKGVDVVVALDVSKSMLAEDIKPNRLERAKQLVNKLMEQMENDRVGLVLFAGRAYIQMPLTADHSAARMFIQNAAPDAVPTQGTVISEALQMSNSAFNSKDRKFKSIILISDGEDHDAEAVKFTQALVKNGVMINSVGIGSTEGTPLIDKTSNELIKDAEGNAIVTKLNEDILKQLAQQTKGVYVHLDDPDAAVATIKKQLSTIEQTAMGDQAFMNYKSYFQWFLGAALLLLLIEFFIPERKKLSFT